MQFSVELEITTLMNIQRFSRLLANRVWHYEATDAQLFILISWSASDSSVRSASIIEQKDTRAFFTSCWLSMGVFTHQVTCLRGNVGFSCIPVNFCQRYTNLWATVEWKKCRWFSSLWMWMDAILFNPLIQCLWTHLTVGMQSHALKCVQRALQRLCS